jgi:RNA polymerase sigma factor (sigma-70 family)
MTSEQAALFEAHKTLAEKIARGFFIVGETEASVRQEALMGLHKAVLAYAPDRGSFETFARTVINNHIRSTCRSLDYRKSELTILDADGDENPALKEEIVNSAPTPSHEAERNEIRQALRGSLNALTEAQREVLEHYAKGGSFAELAKRNETSEQAVRQMFERGLQQMRPRLRASGVGGTRFLPSCEDFGLKETPLLEPKRPASRHGCLGALVVLALLCWALPSLLHSGGNVFLTAP